MISSEIILLLLIFLFSLILLFKNKDLALVLGFILSVLLHKELFSFYSWNLIPIRAFMAALSIYLGIKIFEVIRGRGDIKVFLKELFSDPLIMSLFVLWLIRVLSLFFSKNLSASLSLLTFFTTVLLFFISVYSYLKKNSVRALIFLKIYILIGFILSVLGYLQLYIYAMTGKIYGALWNIPGNIARVGVTFWDVNHYGAFLGALLPLTAIFVLTEKSWKSKIYFTLVSLSLLGNILLTNSRTAWILLFVAFIVFVGLFLFKNIGAKGILLVFISLVLISIPLLYSYSIKSSPFRAKVKQYFHYRMDSFDSHILLLTGAYQVFEEYPILGGGYGSFFEHFSKTPIAATYFGRDPAALNTRVPAHTIWGEVLSETGSLGLLAYLAFFISFLVFSIYTGLKVKDSRVSLLNLGIASVFIGWHVAGVFYSYNSEFYWMLLTLFAGFVFSSLYYSEGKVSFKEIFSIFFRNEKLAYIFLVSLSVLLIFVGLGSTHLVPWDEAIYAQISKNILLTRDWLVLYYFPDKIWYEKPPFNFWAMSLSMMLFGVNSWGARIPSALCGLGTILITYSLGRRFFNRTVAFLSGFILLTTTQFLYYSRASMMDVIVTFFITLAFYFYLMFRDTKSRFWLILAGVSIGLSVLSKGVVGLLPLVVIFLYEFYLLMSKQTLHFRQFLTTLGLLTCVSLIIFMPWHLVMYQKFGYDFIANYLGYHVVERATLAIEDKGRPIYWYVEVLKVSMRLWFVVLIPGMIWFLFTLKKRSQNFIFILFWALSIFTFFSLATSKLVWYIMPVYPALSLVCALFIDTLINNIRRPVYLVKYKTFLLASLVLVALGYLFAYRSLVYTGDLTGSQARLMAIKNQYFDAGTLLHADRIEVPLLLFYLEGPYKVVDFHPNKLERIPLVEPHQEMILLTKKGRYSETIVGRPDKSKIVAEDGDWILWYFEPLNKFKN